MTTQETQPNTQIDAESVETQMRRMISENAEHSGQDLSSAKCYNNRSTHLYSRPEIIFGQNKLIIHLAEIQNIIDNYDSFIDESIKKGTYDGYCSIAKDSRRIDGGEEYDPNPKIAIKQYLLDYRAAILRVLDDGFKDRDVLSNGAGAGSGSANGSSQ